MVPPDIGGAGLGVSKLGSRCQLCSGSAGGPKLMLRGRGGQLHLPVPSFLEGSLHEHCLSGTHSKMNK